MERLQNSTKSFMTITRYFSFVPFVLLFIYSLSLFLLFILCMLLCVDICMYLYILFFFFPLNHHLVSMIVSQASPLLHYIKLLIFLL